MNLEDIPPIREEFRKLGEILENARLDRDRKLGSIIRINSAHERTAIDRIQSDWNREQRNYRKAGRRPLSL